MCVLSGHVADSCVALDCKALLQIKRRIIAPFYTFASCFVTMIVFRCLNQARLLTLYAARNVYCRSFQAFSGETWPFKGTLGDINGKPQGVFYICQ